MDNSEDKKWLYDKLKANGLGISYKDFENTLGNEEDLKWYYDRANNIGLQVGSYDDFSTLFSSKPVSVAQQVIDEYDASMGNASGKMKLPTLEERVNPPQFEPIGNIQLEWQGDRNNAIFIRSQKQRELNNLYNQGTFESFSHKDEEAAIDRQFKAKPVKEQSDILDNYSARFSLTNRGIELQKELAKKQEDLQKDYMQEFMQSDAYKQIAGKKYANKQEVDNANKQINELFKKEYGGKIEQEMKPYYEAYNEEMMNRYKFGISEEYRKLGKKSAAEQLSSLKDDVDNLRKENREKLKKYSGSGNNAMNALMGSRTYIQQSDKDRQESGAISASERLIEQANEVIEEAGKKGKTNFVAGMLRGFRDNAFDAELWTLGLADMADSKYLLDALEKSESGKELTPVEEKLLEASTVNMIVNAYYAQDLGRGYKAGGTFAQSLPFMLEFVINPISASGSGIAKSLLKYGMKKFGAKAVNRGITRAAGRLIGDAAAAAGMTATTGAARTLASSYEKQAENYDYRYDDTGNVVVQKTGDMGQGEALARGFLSNFLDNQSEMVFSAFSGAGNVLSGILPSIGKLSQNGFIRFYNSIKNAPIAKQIRERAKIGGLLEEWGEEVYNNFANVATGEMSAEDALSIDNNIDTFLGLVPTQLAFSAIGLGGLARENMAARKRIRAFEAGLSEEEKNVLTQLQDAVRSGDNNVARDYIKATLADNDLTDQEKKERIFAARDIVTAQQAEQLEQEQTVTEQETDASYAEGASADPSTYHERYKASQQAGAALEQVDPSLYDTINRYVEDDASAGEVDNLLSGLEGETEQLARTYLNSLMQLKGAEDSQMQDAVEAVDAFDQSVQPYAYQNEDGTRSITTGTYKDRPVYVIPGEGGNATVVYEDGSREMALSQYVEGQETTDYDEFIDNYNRIYLEEKEAAFRNFLENHPKTQQPAPGVVLHNGDMTYVITNVSEDGYVDIVPATYDAENGQTVPKTGAAQQTISYSTAMMLQNDYYSALDNQGNTLINTGDSSNLSENKAENETRPSDGESNVSESAVEYTPEQRLANFVATLPKKGKTEEIDYNAMSPQQRYEYTSLIESSEIAAEDLQADIAAKQKQLEAVQKKLDSAVGGKRTEIRDQIRKLRNELKELTDYYQSIATPVQQEQVVPEVASQAQEETSQSLDDAVPDVVNDKSSDARQRGYRMVNGQRVDRQDQIPMQQGRETDVRFSQNDTAKAKFAIVDATYLQPSHIGGVRNSLFFIDEAQPKDRVDNASVMAADRMARDIRPEEITGGVTAYTGSPVVNSRGEVIQGNNRSAALRIMYQIPGADATYREYLNQHAEEYGLTPEQINSVQSPVLVRVADISDNEAIRLGQMTAQDTESGGIERIKPTQTATKLGDSLQSFNRILLSSQEEDVSLSDLVSENGVQALKFLRQQGSISDTQYQSAFDANGNLTPEAKQDLIAILQTSLFEGGPDLLPQMFRALPAKAQKAILSTFVRDQQSPEESRIKKDIQNAIQAFYAAMQFPDFAKATNYESARNAIEQWKRQINMIDGVAPMQVFDNFALELAVRFKGYTMKRITDEFNSYYDLVQGAGADLFSDTASPVEQGEAIRRIFNIQTNEQEGNDAVGSDNTGSEEGRSGSTGSSAGGERNQDEGRSSDTGGRTETTDGSEQQVKTSLSESPESANERRMNQIIDRLDEIEYRLSELEGKTDIFSEAEQITLNNEKNELESEFEGLRKINATSAAIQEARNDVNPAPTEAQKEAGNYKKGHVTIDGLNITIENPKGSTRSGKDASGKEWSVTMQNDYGYIRGTKAVDGDHIDIFLSDTPTSGNVYVVDAIDQKAGAFDESKVMYGFNSLEEARDAYLSNYSEGWKVGPITEVSKEEFKKWIDSSTRKGKPFGEYKSVKSNVTDPQQLPKILKDAYESEDKASITNAETLLREYVDGQNNLKQISTTYFRSMDNLRKEKDKSSPSYKMNDFIAKTCKDALKKAGIAPEALMSEKKRMEFANATKDANVLDVMSVDPSFDVLKAVVRNPNTSNNTLQNIADNTNYSYLSDEAKQILEERNSNQELANENQPNFSPNEPKETEQEEVQVKSKDKFVGYKEFIYNLFEQEELILTPYKNLSEWKEKDEEFYANRYDARIDEFIKRYVSYIKELSDNGTLQRIYDHSSLKNQKVIRDNLADAGIEYKDYIDTKVNRKRIPQKADEKSDLKEGSEVNARFYDGTIVSGTIESIENNKIGIRANNGRLYNVPLNRILDNDDNVLFREVYHGSPADFDRFDHNFMGSGEGAQAYGWGTYVTEVNGIARSYAENLTGRDYTKQINRLAQHIEAQKEFIKTRKADIRKNEDYEKYAKSIRKNLRDSQKEYKSAERAGNEKDMEFYQSLINISNQQLEPEHHKHLIDSFWDDINNAQADIDKSNAEMSDLKNKLKDLKGKRNLYTVEIPEDTGENYLDWEQPISDNQAKMIEDAAKQKFDDEMVDKIMRPVVKSNEFKRVYAILSDKSRLGSDKAVSEFLSRAGFTGIKYPAEATTGGRADGARNYVIFNDKDLEITEHLRFRESLNEVNERFNEELSRYQEGKMETNDLFHLGNPHGVMRMFLPNLPIVMRQRVVKKGSEKKHDVPLQSIIDMPSMISNPIFVFQRDANSIGILTDMTDNDEKNVCVAIELGKTIQNGNEYLEVNDIRSFHGREVKYVVEPIVYNNTLRYANKSKGLAWLSSASQPVQQEIDKQDLSSATKIVENFENPKLDEANFREGQGPQTDVSVSLANDPASRIAGAPRRSRKQQEEYAARERRRMENAANRMVEKLGLDNVEIVTDASTLKGDKAKAKGFYSPSTGKITIVLPNHVSSFDVEQTILHEAVAHYGLRRLFGDNFDTFLDNVYNNASAEIRERINKLAKKYNGNYRTATEEYLASLAEKTDFENAVNSGWFNKIKAFFLKMLSKAGINIPELTDNELRYILWRSYENLAHPGHYRNVFDTAADVAKQNELKVGNYAEINQKQNNAADSDVLRDVSNSEIEMQDIIEKAKLDGTYMKAPNGNPTNLTERQWAQVRTTSFKNWFGDWENDPENSSKVVDENGEPKVVYHGTPLSRNQITPNKGWQKDGVTYIRQQAPFYSFKGGEYSGLIFTSVDYDKAQSIAEKRSQSIPDDELGNEQWTDEGYVYELFLNIRNPFDSEDKESINKILKSFKAKIPTLSFYGGKGEDVELEEAYKIASGKRNTWLVSETPEFLKRVKENRYDGLVGYDEWVKYIAAINPNQIKSATDNTGSFDPTDPDIRFRESDETDIYDDQEWNKYVTNGPKIYQITNETDIDRLPYNSFTKRELKEKLKNKRCTGGYSNRNGAIFLFPEHMSGDTEELELTIWHETAHYASRQLGLDERLKNSCLDYIKNRYPDIYKEITSYYDRSRWSEEAVAYLFERKIKEFGAKKLLSSTFAGESDIAETFTKLINFIKNGKGNTESGRNSGSTGNTSGKNTERSVFGGRGNDLLDERRKIEGGETETDIYDDQELNIVNKEVGSAREQYERTLKTAAFKFTEAWQDDMLGLKEAQDAIAKATNSRILDYENAYIAENAMSSISLAEMDAFRNLVLKPILQEVNNLKKQGAAYAEITDYLMLKHGIERNRRMSVIEALSGDKETMQENIERWNKEYKAVIESSGTWEEKQRQLDEIALTFGAELKDYSGMTDILNEYDNMEERTEEAYRIVNEFEEKYDTEALYDRIHAATDAILKKQVESGLMSKEMYQSISDMYEFYVPLRGWEEKTADEVYDYLTTEHSSFNAPVRKAKGRKSKADDPIANIANVAESGIVQGNRNLVKQRFLTMVQNHRTDLASVNNLWVQEVEREDKNGGTVKEWVAVFPEIAKDATPEQVERIMEAFNKRMEEKSKQEGSNVKRASDMVNIPYKILPKDLKEHQVVVKRAGKPYVITINGNPRAAQAINGLTNPNATENPFIKFVESANRFMAANFTQRNPAFVVANMVRDGIYANTSVWVKEGPLYAAKFNRNWAKSVKEMAGLVARYKANRLDMSNPTDRMFYDFIRNGGETGYTFINSVEDYKGIIQKEIKRANRKTLSPMKAVDVLGNAMDTFGRWAEDASRFAAYRTSREMGRSVSRSINDAKEISVNFNRKGAGAKAAGKWEKGNRINALQAWASQMARGLYIFWNAGVQGLTNFGRMARRNPGKFTAMASSYLVLGSLAPLINEVLCSALGGDDDDSNYYNLPEYVRRNNICLYVGGSWLTIPLPIELRALYGLGEMTCSFLTGKEKYKPVKVAGQISQILPIDFLEGSGGLNAFVPSYVKPLVEVYNNESWTGIPIYRENAFNKDMPNWTKAYKSTSPELIELSEQINSFTGGTKYRKGSVDINPAAIEYLFKRYLGGVATTIDQVKKTAMMPFDEDMQDWRNVVIANRFLKNADERSTQKRINNEYFENKEEFDKVRQEFNGYRKELSRLNPNMEEFAKYRVLMDELIKSDRFRKYQEFHAMDKELNKMFESFKENGSEELEEQMYLKKEAMNEVARSK